MMRKTGSYVGMLLRANSLKVILIIVKMKEDTTNQKMFELDVRSSEVKEAVVALLTV